MWANVNLNIFAVTCEDNHCWRWPEPVRSKPWRFCSWSATFGSHDHSLYLLTERYLDSIRHYLEIRPPPLNLNVLDQVCCVLIRITSCSLNFLIKPCRDYWSHLYWSWRYPCCCPGFCSNFGHTRDRSWACKGMASSSHKVHSYWHGYTPGSCIMFSLEWDSHDVPEGSCG